MPNAGRVVGRDQPCEQASTFSTSRAREVAWADEAAQGRRGSNNRTQTQTQANLSKGRQNPRSGLGDSEAQNWLSLLLVAWMPSG